MAYNIYYNMTNKLPTVLAFTDLHLTKNLSDAKKALSGLSGVYAIVCNVTSAIYTGSSMNMANRLVAHLIDRDTNAHLQNAIVKYGLENFTFVVVEVYPEEDDPALTPDANKVALLAMEQPHLDWLFKFPAEFRYNFLNVAGSSLGYTHTAETRLQLSVAKSGANNPFYGQTHSEETLAKISDALTGRSHSEETRAKMSDAKTGVNHPMYGTVSPTALSVSVYNLDNVLLKTFSSQVAAAEWLGVSNTTVSKYIRSRKVFRGKYLISSLSKL